MTNKLLRTYLAEFIGTGLLVLVGLSAVIFINGAGSPVLRLLPGAGGRRALTGLLFGATGCLITLSPVGEISGAHLNPMVSLAFWLRHNMKFRNMLGYIGAQMAGAAIGSLPLLWWGAQGQSMDYGATLPASIPTAFVGEAWATFCLIAIIMLFISHVRLRDFTPFTLPVLYGFMVWLEAPVSGTSTNPARSFGPALISTSWTGYWLAPFTGVVLAVLLFKVGGLKYLRSEVAKLYHFAAYRFISRDL
ncbi:aquaporin family protein [Hymenobacter sp. UV11]|uniref:MIP/aquaporin family protein n=1 Tax=Hymenobacter sp. UV11 TaxID=1849735 RepID=UPI00105FDED3|nr:MIP/aquaporin family protein [Hymenobacter sp. UV11]TDN39973.1 hypothetical protein A8B98_16135 [Hymenobacter sp. UV11]TFZ62668.1 aquaporin family protein [Hymenobacter sp. UV11]